MIGCVLDSSAQICIDDLLIKCIALCVHFQSQDPDKMFHTVNLVASCVHTSNNANDDSAVDAQGQRFRDIDFRHAPATVEREALA